MTRNSAIRELRLKNGMTQKQFADRVGTVGSYITKIETGKKNLSVNMAKKIGAAFNISWISLFQPEDTG